MKGLAKLVCAISLTICLGLVPIAALAATPFHYAVQGIEFAAFSTGQLCPDYSSFVGSASGASSGSWIATVGHEPLDATPGGMTTICGGSFTLFTTFLGRQVVVTGKFSDGTIRPMWATCGVYPLCTAQVPPGTACAQPFKVHGSMIQVGTSNGSGSLDAILIHYGFWSGSTCIVVVTSLATIPKVFGGVTLIF